MSDPITTESNTPVPNDELPAYILSLTATKIKLIDPAGDRSLNIAIGAEELNDFVKIIPKNKRKNLGKTEFESMMIWFAEQVDKAKATEAEWRAEDEA